MKIYTRTGDDGETGLFGGERVPKDSPRIEAIGAVDEANSLLGFVRSFLPPDTDNLEADLRRVQNDLFDLGADLATAPGSRGEDKVRRITAADVLFLEDRTDFYTQDGPPFRGFVLPGGHPAAAALQVARATVRRAERRVVTLDKKTKINPEVKHYLNRLSDLLFVAARWLNQLKGAEEPLWQKR